MKKLICFFALISMLFTSACQSETTASASATASTSLAAQQAGRIVSELELTDEVSTIKNRVIKGSFFSGDDIYTDACVYMNSDYSADTVGVFYVTDMETALADLEDYLSVLETQTNLYDSTELFKISNAVLENNGEDLIVLIIASDIEEAKRLAKNLVS